MSYVDPDTGEVITAYLFVATLPYSQYGYVEATIDMKEKAWKPKQKASVDGSVGKIATAVIAKLRNEIFTSLEFLNKAIMKAVKEYNDKAFQKRDGSRSTVFNTQEKTYLRALPFIPYKV